MRCVGGCSSAGDVPSALPLALLLLQRLGVRKALVVHSQGLDELTPMGPADVVEVTQQGAPRWQCATLARTENENGTENLLFPSPLCSLLLNCLSLCCMSLCVVAAAAGKRSYSLEPLDLGIPRCTVADLAGGDAQLNARILMVSVGVCGCVEGGA